MSTITKAEAETLKKILRHGGRVLSTMGRLQADSVRATVLTSLAKRGLISDSKGTVYFQSTVSHWSMVASQYLDLTVRAEGCRALNEFEGAEQLRSEKREDA